MTERLEEIWGNIARAALKSGRAADDVTLVAVSKTFPAEDVEAAYGLGLRDFGENRVVELTEKRDVLPGDINWHLIGHLQTNKVAKVVGRVKLIHSLESLRLAAEIDRVSKARGVKAECLIEVNIAAEDSKFGIMPENLKNFAQSLTAYDSIIVKGLMCVAPYVANGEENREYFSKMRHLRVDLAGVLIDNGKTPPPLLLSMGMSGDYAVAVEEGADIVRVGTALFGKR